MSTLTSEVQKLENNYITWMKSISNGPYESSYQREMNNYCKILKNNIEIMKRKIKQLVPTYGRKSKRGAFNVLGNIIKAVTGNLDSQDAEYYDQTIQDMINSNGRLKSIAEKQISLVIDSIGIFNESVNTIQSNQYVLQSRMLQMEAAMNETKYHALEQDQQIMVHAIFNQLILLSNAIIDTMNVILNALTFAKLETFHPSILQPEDLVNELKRINLTKSNKLPIEATIENVPYIENVLKIKAYRKRDSITFIIMVPLVEPEPYNYYHLFPLPIPTNNSFFKIILPSQPYLAINENKFVPSQAKCNEIIPEEYICNMEESNIITKNAPCEVQLLLFTNNYGGCKQITEMFEENRITKITRNKWIVAVPKPIKIRKQCAREQEVEIIHGTYILEITEGCTFTIDERTLQVYESKVETFRKLKIPQLSLKENTTERKVKLQDLKQIQDVHIQKITKLQQAMGALKEELIQTTGIEFHKKPITLWTLILYVFICFIGTGLLIKYGWKHYQPAPGPREATETDVSKSHPLSC